LLLLNFDISMPLQGLLVFSVPESSWRIPLLIHMRHVLLNGLSLL
jgi:hypothetical protein